MIEKSKQKKERDIGYRVISYVAGMFTSNKTVQTIEEARRLGKKKANESARELKLNI